MTMTTIAERYKKIRQKYDMLAKNAYEYAKQTPVARDYDGGDILNG
ncbi:hypothetical protein LCGC14_2702330, partial [marine sediment metagenome]